MGTLDISFYLHEGQITFSNNLGYTYAHNSGIDRGQPSAQDANKTFHQQGKLSQQEQLK